MKRFCSIILVIVLLLTALSVGTTPVSAATKVQKARTIAIVFDNSGSMYISGQQAWCRATYAMEVFAAMLNDSDTLLIYPMNPITVDGKEYTGQNPLKLTDPKQSAKIREICTVQPDATPIESVDAAAHGLQSVSADEKWLIVLTDGSKFYKDGQELSVAGTQKALSDCFNQYAGQMNMLYLGIGSQVAMPDAVSADNFYAEKAADSKDVLSVLTKMCNQIFGRDTLPTARNKSGKLDIDISLSKMIVFVQGENVSGVRVSGSSSAGALSGTAEIKYATKGCSSLYTPNPDKSLQGMLVTYTDCPAGSYTVDYSGTATSIEVYYEPDVDLDFVFTDVNGNAVDPNALYAGDYKVSFGMKDVKTGKLVSSDMLGSPNYEGSYKINGKDYPISCKKMAGEVPVTLEMGDTFDAELEVTYLKGYTSRKTSKDFGWPAGGLTVSAREAGDLRLEITGGDSTYPLTALEDGSPFTAKVYYQGELLTGDALESVVLEWEPETSIVEIKKDFATDHYDLSLHYKNPDAPESNACGECTVSIYARYAPPDSKEAQTSSPLTYTVTDDAVKLQVALTAPQDYIVISALDDAEPLKATVTVNGNKLTDEELAAVQLAVDCGGLPYSVTPLDGQSAFVIQFKSAPDAEAKDYTVTATASVTDNLGRTGSAKDKATVTLSSIPQWLRVLLIFLAIALLLLLLFLFLNQKVLPKGIRTQETEYNIGGRIIEDNKPVKYDRKGKSLQLSPPETPPQYSYVSCGAKLDLKPVSPRRIPSKKRKAEVVKVRAADDIHSVEIGAAVYERDETGNFVKEGSSPTIIGHNSVITVTGTATTANNRKKTAILSQQLNFK